MDKVFQEEQKNLANIENRIDGIARRHEKSARELSAEIQDFRCYDYDDRDKLMDLKRSFQIANDSAKQYRAYQPSPYFGRIDLDSESETSDEIQTITYFIGEEGISDGSDTIVVNWQSSLGDCYYATNQKEFDIKGTKYYLALRRALEIKKGQLISYRTDYDGESVSLEGDVIDPFLLTVLKDKRRHNRLTDIIKTIQGNQNEIIRKPKSDSFVVQGCAGSGKTMILLHRLSYLKFNNRNMSLSGIKIITPNRFFDAHINDLSIKLGLDKIERFSVEEYYVSLIKKYSNKITAVATVESEKTLNTELLTKLYSASYLEESISRYHEYWKQALSSINEDRLKTFYQQFKLIYPDTLAHSADSAAKLDLGIKKIKKTIDDSEAKKALVSTRLETIENEIIATKASYKQAFADLNKVKSQTVTRIELELSSLRDAIQEKSVNLEQLVTQKITILNTEKSSQSEIENNNTSLQNISNNSEKYTDCYQVSLIEDELSHIIQLQLADNITEITQTEEALEKTPLYNFGKRNSLRKKLTEKKAVFASDVTAFITNYVQNLQARQNTLLEQINTCKAEAAILEETITAERNSLKTQKTRHTVLKNCIELFSANPMPNTRKDLGISNHRVLSVILQAYEDAFNNYNKISQKLETLHKNKLDLENEQIQLSKSTFSEDDVKYITACENIAKQLQLGEVFKNVMFKDLFAQYRNYGQKYHKTNFRHKLYLKLLYCSLYFARSISQDNFLNIDEAQDISVAEYRLLRTILGERCIFNLYGDINQSVYSYKGINDWDEIAEITGGNIHVLNENYRNTLQITNFCNKEFEAEVYPIGISGAPVLEQNTADAIKWLINMKKENPEHRVAIIHRHGLKAAQELLESLLCNEDISWYVVNDKKISVISVETAKGLEFESVVAIVDQMSNNEKYITYTRALDNLSVVRDEFSHEMIVDDTDEEFEDEFVTPTEDTKETVDNTTTTPNEPSKENFVQDQPAINDSNSSSDKDNVEPEKNTNRSIEKPEFSHEDNLLIAEFQDILAKKFDVKYGLSTEQQQILLDLYSGHNIAFSAPSGSMKSNILFLLTLKERQTSGKQTILTAEAHLQENELALAEKLGLRGGIIGGSMDEFLQDFKKEKYDIIFAPYEFFESPDNIAPFVQYFSEKIAYWGIDHPLTAQEIYPQLNNVNISIRATMYLMSKEGFADLDLTEYKLREIEETFSTNLIKKQNLFDAEEKLKWIVNNLDKLYGQGLVYCNDETTCKVISKQLCKKKIMSEAYIDIDNPDKKERINYLTNAFSNGGIQVLVTTHEVGKNLSNPNIRFVLHYDMPVDEQLYQLHTSQVGQLDKTPVVYDLLII